MQQLYELTTLSCPLVSLSEASKAAQAWVTGPDAKGNLLGCWRSEIGVLGRLLFLRGFENADQLATERRRALFSVSPFNAANVATELAMDSYAPFPFLPPVQAADHGGIYELRSYRLKPGGLPPTLAGWERAIGPARDYTAHLVINMYALDGPVRITHIWGYGSLDERGALRAKQLAAGTWPPKGGPENILEATSTIARSETYSPLS
jgi:hypothetical protein